MYYSRRSNRSSYRFTVRLVIGIAAGLFIGYSIGASIEAIGQQNRERSYQREIDALNNEILYYRSLPLNGRLLIGRGVSL